MRKVRADKVRPLEGVDETPLVIEEPPAGKKGRMPAWVSLLIKIAVLAALVYAASYFVNIYPVHSNGMFPSFRDGDMLVTLSWPKPAFNSVIVYRTYDADGTEVKHLGRIMSLGDTEVELDDYGNFLVNGSIINTNNYYEEYDKGSIGYPYKVPADHLFIMQDYRPETDDSRTYGAIPVEDVIGTVSFCFRVRGF